MENNNDRINSFLADDSRSHASGNSVKRNTASNNHPTTSNNNNGNGNNKNNNNSGERNGLNVNTSHPDYDYERQDFSPIPFQSSTAPTTSYIPQYRMDNGSFPIQEVVPNAQMVMTSSADPNGDGDPNAHLRARGQTAVNANILNFNMNDNVAPGGPPINLTSSSQDNGDGQNEQEAPNIPMMVKPKTLYQNPQTPTVLPSTYHPINEWSSVKSSYLKEFLAEFLGTMVLIIFGDAVCCQVGLAAKLQQNAFEDKLEDLRAAGIATEQQVSILKSFESLVTSAGGGTFDEIPFGWAAAVVMGYFTAGGSAISGAHLNPSITISNFIFRGFPKKKIPLYLSGQLLGGFAGALIVWAYYNTVIKEAFPDYQTSQTVAGFFCTFPQSYLSTPRQFLSEFITTAMLQVCIFALTDPYTCLSSDLFPIMLFFLIYILNASMSYQTGSAINFARDLGPRLAIWAIGFNKHILWINHHHYFWIPMVAPFIGATMGGLVYDVCVYQGHESPVNWPIGIYKEMLVRAWHRRPGWKNRNRVRATSDLSDFSYKNDDDDDGINSQTGEKIPKVNRQRSASSDSELGDQPRQKSVQFKSVSRGNGYRDGVPTILEEEDSIETASLGESGSSMMLSEVPSSQDYNSNSFDKKAF